MSHATTILRRCYEIHGVRISVCAEEPAVIEAMELRLRDFRGEPGPQTGVRLEFVLDRWDRFAPRSGASRPVYDTPHGSLHYFPDTDELCGMFGGVDLHCEVSRGVAVFRSAAFTGRELYLATHPLATISLMELLERRGLFSLHAACLATGDGRGVLLAGASGAGKSTLSLALARAGMSFLSDDVVFLAHTGGSTAVRALGFADTVGISDHAAARFGDLQALLGPAADGFPKQLGRIEELLGTPALGSCEPCALVFPEVSLHQRSDIAPLDPREALLRLVPDVLVTEAAATQAHLRAIAALLDQVRCYALRSGTDLGRAAELVRELI
jgi:hypothetical protein